MGVPIWILIIVIAIIIIVNLLGIFSDHEIAFPVVAIATSFSAILVSFILVYAISRYDASLAQTNIFVRRFQELDEVIRKIDPSLTTLMDQYINDYINHAPSSALLQIQEKLEGKLSPTLKTYITTVLAELSNSSNYRRDLSDEIPNTIWLTVFFILFFLSYLITVDNVVGPVLSAFLILVIWLPTLVVYSIFETRENEIKRRIQDLYNRIQKIRKSE